MSNEYLYAIDVRLLFPPQVEISQGLLLIPLTHLVAISQISIKLDFISVEWDLYLKSLPWNSTERREASPGILCTCP